MPSKPYTEIKSLTPEFVAAVVVQTGIPHNWVDSAEGSLVGMPDIDSDPASREVVRRIEAEVAELGKTAVQAFEC